MVAPRRQHLVLRPSPSQDISERLARAHPVELRVLRSDREHSPLQILETRSVDSRPELLQLGSEERHPSMQHVLRRVEAPGRAGTPTDPDPLEERPNRVRSNRNSFYLNRPFRPA